MNLASQARDFIKEHDAELVDLIRTLCAIPAPSNQEEQRALFCQDWLTRAGGKAVIIDDALNVVCPVGDVRGEVVVIMAHTDTVFPDLEPLPLSEREGRIYCPGVCDDTTNLALLMMTAKYVLQAGLRPECGLVFAANAGEEGLGNLKGSKKLMADYGGRTREVISLDGTWEHLCNQAVGSARYRVVLKTEGGHAFSDFGNRNAIHLLASLIASLYALKVPQESNSRSTYNVGQISGGTSVNTIAEQAEMLVELRSDSEKCLAELEAMFSALIEAYSNMGAAIQVTTVGRRPCSGQLKPGLQEALTERYTAIVRQETGQMPEIVSGSTDCNIPLAMGIPAVSCGAFLGAGFHTRGEWLDLAGLKHGWPLVMSAVLQYFA